MSEDAMMDSSMDSHLRTAHTALLPARQQSITEARSHVKEGLQAKQDPEPILRMRPSQNGFRTTYNAMLRTFLYRS